MISKDETKELARDISKAFINKSYDKAIDKLQQIYDTHLADQDEEQQTQTLAAMLDHIRQIFGYVGKQSALAGIRAAGQFLSEPSSLDSQKYLAYQQKSLLLNIGRLIFNGGEYPVELQELMFENFDGVRETIQHFARLSA